MKLLVVEDEMMVAMLIEDMLDELGFEPPLCAVTLDQALDLAAANPVDAAVLDVNLNGAESFPVADLLREKRTPFIFSTGYGRQGIPDRFKETQTLQKPFRVEELRAALEALKVRETPSS